MNNDAAPRQLTFRAVVLAIVLAVILSAANAYLGLFAGLTIATAIPAAVISMGVLRLLGGGTILENNIVQTGASAGSSIAAGVIFTIPALVIMGYWPDFKYWWVLGIAGLGGLLGVLFSVPLRRSMIVEDPLPFPEGKAAAEVLKAGENPGPGLKILAVSAVIGAFVKLAAESGLRLIPDAWATSAYVGSSKITAFIGTNLSPALLGVGYIVGLNVGIVVVSGSILTWHIAIPLYQSFFMNTDPALAASIATATSTEAAFAIWGAKMRYLGVGAMLIGGVWTLISLRKSLLNGVKSGFAAARKSGGPALAHTERDLPMKWMLVALVVFTLPLLALYQAIVGQWHVSIPMTLIMIVAGFLFVSVSAYLAGLIGSSNNPVSGITISTILFASAVLVLLLGKDGLTPVGVGGAPLGAVAAIMIGAVVCCAAAVGGDNLQDLKAGYIVVEAAADAGHRRVLVRADHGPGAEPAGHRLRHRREVRAASQRAGRTAGEPDGLGGQGPVRWRTAVDLHRHRCRGRRGDHRLRQLAEVAQCPFPRAGAGRGDRYLPAAGTDGADLPGRPDRLPGGAFPQDPRRR